MFCTQLGSLESPDLRYPKSPGALHVPNVPKNVNGTLTRKNPKRDIILIAIFHIFCHQYD